MNPPRRKSPNRATPQNKCGKLMRLANSKLRLCKRQAVKVFFSRHKGGWVFLCSRHVAEFRRRFPAEVEGLRTILP
jgi:hypothetical protein